jgi:hypothetical protein
MTCTFFAGKPNCIGYDSRADERALARMGETVAAAKPVGWPGDVRKGILDGASGREYPAHGGRMRRSFSPKRDLNRPMRPRLPDLPGKCEIQKRRSDLGREGRLRGALERETPLHPSPQARAPFRPIEKDRSTVAGQAGGIRGGNEYPYASQRMFVGAEIAIDINILLATKKYLAHAD